MYEEEYDPGEDSDEILGDFTADSTNGEDEDEEEDEKFSSISHAFSRDGGWLEEATATLLDASATGSYPLGELSEEDVECIGGVMAAWSRRSPGSLRAALSVEKLLKRVADDVRAGNPSARVTTRLYTYVRVLICVLFLICV
jgi:hypothetical protein